jgi:probable HAF family extracellular repeat protein
VAIVDLGLSGSGQDAQPWSINEAGSIAGARGDWSGPSRAFLWSPGVPRGTGGTALDLPVTDEARAMSVNDASQVVGFSFGASGIRAFLYDGAVHELGVPDGWTSSYAHGINDGTPRLVVGAVERSAPYAREAAVWTVTDVGGGYAIVASGALTGLGGTRSEAFGVNEAGTVVGGAENAAGQQRPVRWAAGTLIPADLGVLAGHANGYAWGINAAGTIVGNSYGSGCGAAVVWAPGAAAPTALPGLGGCNSDARSINDAGDIAGYADRRRGGARAVIWRPSGSGYAVTELGAIKGSASSIATGLNEPVEVAGGTSLELVGWSTSGAQAHRATLWTVFRPSAP